MSWWLYILRCGDGTLYCGITNDVARRLRAHRAGRGARYTRGRTPLRVVYEEEIGVRGDALRSEGAWKRLPRDEKLRRIADARRRQRAPQRLRKTRAGLPATTA